jgi:hypothetical protein
LRFVAGALHQLAFRVAADCEAFFPPASPLHRMDGINRAGPRRVPNTLRALW